MTRTQIVTRALRIIGDSSLTTQANEWLDHILLEIESAGFWRFLEATATQATSNGVFTYALPATYSKGLDISSSGPHTLINVPHHALREMREILRNDYPRFFSIFGSDFYVYPTPVTGILPTLTLGFYKKITLPTADGDVIETVVGLPIKWQKYLIDGVAAEGCLYSNDNRYETLRAKFEQDLLIMVKENEDWHKYREEQFNPPSISVRPETQT